MFRRSRGSTEAKLLAAMILIPLSCFGGDTALSDGEIEEAIALGKQYKNVDKLWDHEFEKTHTFKLSGFWNKTSTRKRASVMTDYVLVAMASAVAAHEMREFSLADARLLPLLGKLRVVVHIYGLPLLIGGTYLAQLDETFGSNRTHMVLDHNGTIIQPERKMQVPSGVTCDTDFWSALETDNAPKGGTFLHGDFVYAFVYDLRGERTGDFKLVLVGNDNKKFTVDLNPANLR
jgi:hypothetical protein